MRRIKRENSPTHKTIFQQSLNFQYKLLPPSYEAATSENLINTDNFEPHSLNELNEVVETHKYVCKSEK